YAWIQHRRPNQEGPPVVIRVRRAGIQSTGTDGELRCLIGSTGAAYISRQQLHLLFGIPARLPDDVEDPALRRMVVWLLPRYRNVAAGVGRRERTVQLILNEQPGHLQRRNRLRGAE